MNTSGSKKPTMFIAFHIVYDYRGRLLIINKDLRAQRLVEAS